MEDKIEIDVTIMWVDNSDPLWLNEFKTYSQAERSIRYKALDSLKYLFRGLEKFMPWIRKVHFVTYGHYPKWLNINHPKLHIVKHSDIFPDKSVLPTFNSGAIEMNLHNIKDLSEQFIHFNDDFFITKRLSPEYFFTKRLPNDYFLAQSLFHDGVFSHILHSNMQIVNREIKKDKSFKKLLLKSRLWKKDIIFSLKSIILLLITKEIPLLHINHHAQAHLKSNFIEMELAYGNQMNLARANRLRSPSGLNQYIFRYWGLIKGKYYPKRHKDSYYIGVIDLETLEIQIEKLKKLSPSLVCFNEHEGFKVENYREYENMLTNYLNSLLPEKSKWEI